ncbi:rhodanese-like domain-containing protein [Nitratidesulfovibrio sp. 1201_IL3209]|uniref:rhodanese-like domain-containing protein n=1 Tax=Nitratidesulfovibrio sp. 1201_IL3209 TaxID=3084053 RepID=UPI002FDABBFF
MRRIVVIGSGVGAGKLAARVKRLLPGCEVNMIMPEAGPKGDAVGGGGGGPFAACLAARRASRALLAAREVGVLDAAELSVDLDASTVIAGSSRGRLAVRYDQLAMEIDATPRIPRALRGAPNVFAWPGADVAGLDGLLAERVAAGACRTVVVGQGAEALEALRLVRAAGATPVWVRTRPAAGDAANAVDADMWRHAARMARRNGVETVNWTGVAMERMGALPAGDGGFAALVAVAPDRADGTGGPGGTDLRVEGDLFIWTSPLVVQNPALTLDGISLDDTGRIDVDGCLRTGAPGVYVFGTGVGVQRMAPDGGVEQAAAVPAEVPGLVRALADHLASIDATGADVSPARGVAACPAGDLAAELAGSGDPDMAELADALGDCPCRLPALGAVHAEGPGVTVAAVGLGSAACARAEVETEFSVYATPAATGSPKGSSDDDDESGAWGGLPAGHAVKLLAARTGGALLGAQVAGRDAELCAAVVSAASLALRAGMRVADLAQAELPGAAGELLRRAAAVLANKLAGRYFGITPDEFIASREAGAEFFTLDLRSAPDWRAGHVPGAYNIPHTQLRKRLQDEVPRFIPIVLVAATSDAAWSVACMLGALGATDLYVLDGGMAFWPHALETA